MINDCVERQLEEHEILHTITFSWPKKSQPHFVLRNNERKYLLWKEPPVRKLKFSM